MCNATKRKRCVIDVRWSDLAQSLGFMASGRGNMPPKSAVPCMEGDFLMFVCMSGVCPDGMAQGQHTYVQQKLAEV